MNLKQFDRSALAQSATSKLRKTIRPWHFTVCEARLDGRTVVWKDAGDCPWPFRPFLGAVLRREARALQALSEMEEVPELLGMTGRHGFVMEWMEGARLPRRGESGLSLEFFDALRSSLEKMNKLGVVHGDLRRKNIFFVPGTQRPVLIDFGTAIVAGDSAGWLRRTVWRKTRRIDWVHFAKLKEHYFPGSLTTEEREWLANAPWYYRLGSFLRARVYRPLKWRRLRRRFGRE